MMGSSRSAFGSGKGGGIGVRLNAREGIVGKRGAQYAPCCAVLRSAAQSGVGGP